MRISRNCNAVLPVIVVIWILLITHGILFIVTTPLWEGFDEPFHYAYIQYVAETGRIPVYGEALISKEVTSSFQALPLSAAVNSNLGNRYTDFPSYFDLPEFVKTEREYVVRHIPRSKRSVPDTSEAACLNYEAQHPPLYYFLGALVYRIFQGCDLPTRILALRFFSLLIGSVAIIISYKIARLFYPDKRRILFFPLMIALLPMFISTVARISNDCLGVALFSLLVYFVLKYIASGCRRSLAIYIGIVLGLGLLTKAYFLTALPVVAIVLIASGIRQRSFRQSLDGFLWVCTVTLLLSGAWYVRNYSLYGTVSGLFVMASKEPVSFAVQLKKIFEIPWLSAIHIIFKEQLWIGNSTFISISKTYYQLGYFIFGMSALGVAVYFIPGVFKFIPVLKRRYREETKALFPGVPSSENRPGYTALVAFCFFFILGMMYQIHQTFLITEQIATGGWYLYAIVTPQILLLLMGLETLLGYRRRRLASILLITGAFVVNFLGYFCKAIPYYAGFKIPRFNLKHLFEVYSFEGFRQVTEQLSLNKPVFITPMAVGIVISLYFVVMLVVLTLWARMDHSLSAD